MIPYGRQLISEDDINAVVEVLKSSWVTTGPKVTEFEEALAAFTGAEDAVCFSSGTAALHAAMAVIDIRSGDEVIVSPMTFAASANCILYQGGTPVFADIDPDTLLIDPRQVEKMITSKTRAIIAVDYAGQPCDYTALRKICNEHSVVLVADACHSLGAEDAGVAVGCLADISVLSFHPVKHICTGEGGALLLNDKKLAEQARRFRNHGITADPHQRNKAGTWDYDMESLGFNYRLTDLQCALGISQLKRLPAWLKCRAEVAAYYDEAFIMLDGVNSLKNRENIRHAYHLYVIRVDKEKAGIDRNEMFKRLRNKGIGVNVHYKPVFNHSYYKKHLPDAGVDCPVTLGVADEILSLPIFPSITDDQLMTVVNEVKAVLKG